MLFGFVGFLISASMENYYDKKLKDLNKKYNFEYIKIKPKVKKWYLQNGVDIQPQ